MCENKSFFFHANTFQDHCSVLKLSFTSSFHLLWDLMKHFPNMDGATPHIHRLYFDIYFSFPSCRVVRNDIHFKPPKLFEAQIVKCTCEVNEIRIFHTNKKKKTQGPTMYTSTTVCSLCIVELQQRHSELVNGAITSNNMSYLTKTLSHCHWMCFMSNKRNPLSECLVHFFFLLSLQVFLEASAISCRINK